MGVAGNDERVELGFYDERVWIRRWLAGVVVATFDFGCGAAGRSPVASGPERAEMVVCGTACG